MIREREPVEGQYKDRDIYKRELVSDNDGPLMRAIGLVALAICPIRARSHHFDMLIIEPSSLQWGFRLCWD